MRSLFYERKVKMFRLTLNRVRDHIIIKEGNDQLKLTVDQDPRVIAVSLKAANETLGKITVDASTFDRIQAAKGLSEAIFGKEQTKNLFRFYGDDPGCVVTICGMYFEKRLAKKIIKAQKRSR